jgi:hypothetical protein
MTFNNAAFETVKAQLQAVEGVADVSRIDDAGDAVRVRLISQSDNDIRPAVYQAVKQTDWTLLEFCQEAQTLENIFRELTREN